MFRVAKQNRIFQDVVDQVQDIILSGKIKPGDTLPPERELKDMLQVSRGTLREALRVLEQKGLIEIKLGVGGGAVVKDVGYDLVNESLALLIRYQKVSLAHLSEFRAGVEGKVAAMAARRYSEKEMQEVKDLLDQAKAYMEKGESYMKAFVDVDKQIHLSIAKMTGNPVYISLQNTVNDNIDQYYESFLSMKQAELEENYADLCNIVSAVEQKQEEKARKLAEEHVLKFNHYMEKKDR